MPDTTTEVKAILARTLRELEQVIDNAGAKSILRGLGDILDGVDDGATAATKPVSPRTPPAKRKAVAAPRESAARRAPVAGGRREQLLALVVDQPGITLAQAAKQFGVKDATGLYRVARRLQDEGLVRKRGAELHPTAKAKRK